MEKKIISAIAMAMFLAMVGGVNASSDWWDSGYQYRQQVTVDNNAASVMESGYTVEVAFNDGGKTLASGDDIRVVYNGVELDRILGTGTITFATQADIAAGGSDSDYYMYYGNPNAGPAPADANKVYLLYDDFTGQDGDSPNSDIWAYALEGSGCKASVAPEIRNNQLYVKASHDGGECWSKLRSIVTFDFPVYYESTLVSDGYNKHCNTLNMGLDSTTAPYWVYADTISHAQILKVLSEGVCSSRTIPLIDTNSEIGWYNSISVSTPFTARVHTLHDNKWVANVGGYDLEYPWAYAYSPYRFLIMAMHGGTRGEYAEGWFDDVMVRRYIATEPTTSTGSEEVPIIGDKNKGHGNDPDGVDEDNPGRGCEKKNQEHGNKNRC